MAEAQPPKSDALENLNKEISALVQVKEEKKAAPKARRRTAPKQKTIVVKARRKSAIARARITKGNGRITINNINANLFKPRVVRELILEPVNFSPLTKEVAGSSDIKINVRGGGASGQAQASRSAIAKAISAASTSDVIKNAYMKYDRTMLVDDVRQVEPKKFLGTKARARFQKSYR
ncbi:MAG: 30S ribosomal protein S9 [Candidatus Micrarchaeota archaeon]|nr:30S ribosomal protein S9 [Candidatus Micrarchaeota archaeon]